MGCPAFRQRLLEPRPGTRSPLGPPRAVVPKGIALQPQKRQVARDSGAFHAVAPVPGVKLLHSFVVHGCCVSLKRPSQDVVASGLGFPGRLPACTRLWRRSLTKSARSSSLGYERSRLCGRTDSPDDTSTSVAECTKQEPSACACRRGLGSTACASPFVLVFLGPPNRALSRS